VQGLTRAATRVLNLDDLRTANATAKALAGLADYPYYVHKWTKQKRHYTLADLRLPQSMFAYGRRLKWRFPVIGVGGTRSPTVETFCLVSNIVRELARSGATIISGGVPGVDLAAHISASDEERGTTVAVLANPVELNLRGQEWHSTTVAAQIVKRGAFLSEYADPCEVGGPEYCERLLARDRIISGLSDLFLVFECNEDSATIDTARRAVAQGKKIQCVNSVRKSPRQGIEQLSAEFGLPVLDERTNTPAEMAKAILSGLARKKPLMKSG
jgi:predicted Rossmann fold nucleotide-binding protein DprA/Smf involved in DNA uptake